MYYFGPFRLDAERLLLTVGKRPLHLGPKVVQTLLVFVERPGETLTKGELLDRVWPEGFVEEGNLAQNVYVLRKVLRAHWNDVIETVPRLGIASRPTIAKRSPMRAKRSTFRRSVPTLTSEWAWHTKLSEITARPKPRTAGTRFIAEPVGERRRRSWLMRMRPPPTFAAHAGSWR